MSEPYHSAPLVVNRLRKSYGKLDVIRDFSLRLEAQAIYGLVGLNGSGKTSTLECLLGLQAFDGGEVSVLGLPPARLYQAAGAVIGIFDTPSLHPNLSVRQCLEHARLLCPQPRRSCAELEKLLDIERYRDVRIRHLSLGNRRRASLAQGLLGQPELVILDEPFNGLDAAGVDQVLALIQTLNQQEGTSFLLSSHQLPYLEHICSHLGILHQGELVLSEAVSTLLGRQHSSIRVRCHDEARAVSLVKAAAGVDYVRTDAAGYSQFELSGSSAEAVNALLVSGGVGVSELLLERPSLSSLFRDLTSGQA
ncbi:MAG: ABC transporter ATP-binding protein [Pseudomonadales bacterium]|nr:ABC transporter ATP-binding protein [Pseudomonadales bacterium]